MEKALRVYLGLIGFSILGTAMLRFGFAEPIWLARFASLATILAGSAVLWGATDPPKRTRLFAALALGAVAEISGLYTGFPFGEYRYTGAWWPSVPLPGNHYFPVALPFAWLMVAGAARLLMPASWPGWKAAIAGGLLAALVDIPMEPVFTGPLGYWEWLHPGPLPGGAPWLNFFGWFLVSFLLGLFLPSAPQEKGRRFAGGVLLGHLALVAAMAALRPAYTQPMLAMTPLILPVATPGNLTEAQRVQKIVAHAREQTTWGTVYDGRYVKLSYPGGDLPKSKGVCTDVVIRAWRTVGFDLQKLVHEDKKRRPSAYPKYSGQKGPDKNIDHRRVKNLVVFFRKFGRELPRELGRPASWKPGDLVTWKLPGGLDHIGVLTDKRNSDGYPLVVHNIGGTREEDVLTAWPIVGHFRYP